MSESGTRAICPVCGGALAHDALEGVCPACAWNGLGLLEADEDARGRAGAGALVIGGHEVLEELGRGGGGIVYRVMQPEPRREVALKILRSQEAFLPEMHMRFRAEAETVAALDHAGILPVYLVGEHDGLPFYTMKLATGGSLAARQVAVRASWRDIAGIVARVADAVQFAHERGVIHRDLKPANILFDEAGVPFVADFGMARFVSTGAGVTLPGAALGTPAYMAPEVAERGAGAATVAADVYGLGAILYELLAGRPPFQAGSIVTLLKDIALRTPERPGDLRAGVPRDLEVICLRCLSKDPAGRFSTAGALAADLRRWLAHRPIESRPVSALERAWSWARRNPALALLSGALAAGAVVAAVMLTASNRSLRVAEAEARVQLRAALLAEGHLLVRSGERGQRHEALAVLARASAIEAGLDVRSAVAAALARPDVRIARQWDAAFPNEGTITAFSPDLAQFFEAFADGTFALRTTADGARVRSFDGLKDVPPHMFAFSADGARVHVLFRNHAHQVWDIGTGQLLWERAGGEVALHPTDAGLLAHADGHGGAWLRDLRRGEERALTAGTPVEAMAFDRAGRRLAVVRAAGVEFLDAGTLEPVGRSEARCTGAPPAWSPDGRLLAVGGLENNSIHVIDTNSGRVLQTLRGHSAYVTRVQFHPDGRRLWSLAGDSTVRLWDALAGTEALRINTGRRGLGVSADGRLLGASTTPRDVTVFEIAPEGVLREFTGGILGGDFSITHAVSPDGRWLASCDRSEIRVWHADTGRAAAAFLFVEPDWPRVHFSPAGDALVYSGRSQGIFRRSFRPAADGAAVELGPQEEIGKNRDGMLLGFARDGRDWFIEREVIERVVVWPDGRPELERPAATSGRYERPDFSADGRWVVTMGYPVANTRLWRADTGELIGPVPVRHHSGATFSPDGAWLLTNHREGYQLWGLPEFRPGAAWPAENSGGAAWGAAAFSPDGATIACEQGPGRVVLRSARTGEVVLVLAAPLHQALSHLSWSPDGGRLFLFFDQHRLFCWEIGALRRELAARGLGW